MAEHNRTMFVLTVMEPGEIPSVEVCESMKDVMDSVRYQLDGATSERLKEVEDALNTKRVWVDANGTKYAVRQSGGR